MSIVDDLTKASVDIVADHGISGHDVVRVMNQAARFRVSGLAAAIRTDQGPEFTGHALDQWACRNGVQLSTLSRQADPECLH